MAQWVIVLPAWGEWYVSLCERYTIPALRAAIAIMPAGQTFVFHVYTDAPERLEPLLSDLGAVEVRPVPYANRPFESFAETHRRTLQDVPRDACVVLLNADLVVSIEFLLFAMQAMAAGYKAVTTVGTRTLPRGDVPVGANARALAQWAWRNRHPIVDDSIWGEGRSFFPSCLFFRNGENVAQHAFYQTPFVIRNDGRDLNFQRSTDDNLLDVFAEHEIFLVQDNEVSLAEVSPPDKTLGRADRVGVETVALWVAARMSAKRMSDRNLWVGSHKLSVCGDKRCVDDRLFYSALARMRALQMAAA